MLRRTHALFRANSHSLVRFEFKRVGFKEDAIVAMEMSEQSNTIHQEIGKTYDCKNNR